MSASNLGYRVVMLENSNSMMNKVIEYIDPKNVNMYKKNISSKNKIIYYFLNSNGEIIGVITLDKIKFTDFQNDANNDKVYSFGINIRYTVFSPLFISEVWNDFINIKGNFIYCSNLNKSFIKELIEDLNKLYNIYYNLNFENIDVIFGRKVEGKKKYLKIKDGKDYRLTKNTKSEYQKGHINAYLRNYPNNNPNKNKQNRSLNSNGPAIPSTKPSYSNGPAIPSTTFLNNQSGFNETTPLLGKKKSTSFFGKLKKFFKDPPNSSP